MPFLLMSQLFDPISSRALPSQTCTSGRQLMQSPTPEMLHWVKLSKIWRTEMREGLFESASATSRTGEVQIGVVRGVWAEYRGLSMKIDLNINFEIPKRNSFGPLGSYLSLGELKWCRLFFYCPLCSLIRLILLV